MRKLIYEAKSVCIDADDTTANFFASFLDYYNALHGTSFVVTDFWTRKFNLVLGCTVEEAQKEVDEFQHSSFFRNILPIDGAIDAVNRLFAMGKKLYVVTSRADYTKSNTERFYDFYFKDKFLDIFHSSNNHTGRQNSGKSKLEICKELRAPLIDDDLEYVLPCIQMAFGGILFGDYRWQTGQELSLGVPRLKKWEEFDL